MTFMHTIRLFLKNNIYFEKKTVDPKLCIMLSNQTLFMIELHKKNSNYLIHTVIQEPLPESWFEDNQLVNDTEFGNRLKKIYSDHPFKTKKVVLISDSPTIIMRIMTVPKTNAQGINEYIHKQLSSYTLFSGHELYKNWKILDTVEVHQEPHYRVIVLACKQDTFTRWEAIMKHAQLSLFGISTHTAGLVHQLSHYDDDEDKLIICAEPQQTSYIVWTDRSLKTIHYDPTPLSNHMDTDTPTEPIDSVIQLLHADTNACQIYFYAPLFDEPHRTAIEPFIHRSGGALLNESSLLADCVLNNSDEQLIKKVLPAIGVGKMTEADLLIVDSAYGTPYYKVLLHYLLISLSIATIMMLSIFFIFHHQSKGLTEEIQLVKHELITTNKEFEVVRNIDISINLMKKLILARRKLIADAHPFNAELFYANLSTLIPDDTRIQSFQMNEKGVIIIQGEAMRSDAVFKLLQNLKTSPFLDTAKLNKVENNDTHAIVEFTITTQRQEPQ